VIVELRATPNVALLKLCDMAAAFGIIETPRRLDIIMSTALAEMSLSKTILYY
jgi:hypothetical protein